MELANEDKLRLNVLLASKPLAIRINESSMTVYALGEQNEMRLQLNPVGRDEAYLKQVRELISGHILGSPGGYPVYLQRWTRMGQAKDSSLEQLLMLGEPEAVVAVVYASGLTPELARRAWWALPNAENARRMLENENVARSPVARELVDFLLEFLPFEEEPVVMADSVRLVLSTGLLSETEQAALWRKGRHKNACYLGFLEALPDDLPEQGAPHPMLKSFRPALEKLAAAQNPFALALLRVYSAPGQAFIALCGRVLQKPSNQEVVSRLFDIIAAYFSILPLRDQEVPEFALNALMRQSAAYCENPQHSPFPALAAVLHALPQSRAGMQAMLTLAGLGYGVLRPVFSHTEAIGSLMRKKLTPVTTPLLEQMDVLLGKAPAYKI